MLKYAVFVCGITAGVVFLQQCGGPKTPATQASMNYTCYNETKIDSTAMGFGDSQTSQAEADSAALRDARYAAQSERSAAIAKKCPDECKAKSGLTESQEEAKTEDRWVGSDERFHARASCKYHVKFTCWNNP